MFDTFHSRKTKKQEKHDIYTNCHVIALVQGMFFRFFKKLYQILHVAKLTFIYNTYSVCHRISLIFVVQQEKKTQNRYFASEQM